MSITETRIKERMTYAEAAEYCAVSVRTIKRWVNRGWIAAGRFTTKSVFVLRSELDRMAENLVKAEAGRGSEGIAITLRNICEQS